MAAVTSTTSLDREHQQMSARTIFVVSDTTEPPRSRLDRQKNISPLGAVMLDRTFDVIAADPAHLLLIAEAFTDAARMLSDELDKRAARDISRAQS